MARRDVRSRRGLTLGLLLRAYRVGIGRAACNVIPVASQTFRAIRTTIDRPFAGPGDFVTLGLDPTCYTVERTDRQRRQLSFKPGSTTTPPGGA